MDTETAPAPLPEGERHSKSELNEILQLVKAGRAPTITVPVTSILSRSTMVIESPFSFDT